MADSRNSRRTAGKIENLIHSMQSIWRNHPEVVVAIALYIAALAVRLPFTNTPPYGDDAAHFTVANTLWQHTHFTQGIYIERGIDHSVIFWQRPIFYLLLAPFAEWSFHGFRIGMVLFSSAVPALTFLVAHRATHRIWINAALAAALTIYPVMVVFGIRAFPDQIAAVFILAALLARDRPWLQAALLVAAVWTKETAIVAVAALLVWHAVQTLQRKAFDWRVESRRIAPLATAFVLSPLALLYSLSIGQRFPGWTHAAGPFAAVDAITGSIWLTLPVLLAIVLKPREATPYVAAALIAFFGVYNVISGLKVQQWYVGLVLPFIVVSAGIAICSIPRGFGFKLVRPTAAVVTMALLLIPAGVNSDTTMRHQMNPFSGPSPALVDSLNIMETENRELVELDDYLSGLTMDDLVLVDVGWFFMGHPFSKYDSTLEHTRSIAVEHPHTNESVLFDRMSTPGVVTVIEVSDPRHDVQERLLADFEPCIVQVFEPFYVIRGSECGTQ